MHEAIALTLYYLNPLPPLPSIPMSFADIESGLASPTGSLAVPQSQEESSFLTLQSSLSLQVFKINSNVQGILKLVDQLGTSRDSGQLRKSLCVHVCCYDLT